MELITTHFCKAANVGYHGNLFGGTMLAWLDEAGVAFASEICGTPRMVTVHMAEVLFNRPARPTQIIKIYGEVEKMGNTSVAINLEARRHSVYNGSQKTVCSTQITFVRIDGDGEPVPIPKERRLDWSNEEREEYNV